MEKECNSIQRNDNRVSQSVVSPNEKPQLSSADTHARENQLPLMLRKTAVKTLYKKIATEATPSPSSCIR